MGGHKKIFALFIAATLLVIVFGAAAAYKWYQPFTRAIDGARVALMLPVELREAHFYTSGESYTSFRLGSLGLVENTSRTYFVPSGNTSPDGSRIVFAFASSTDNVMPFVSGLPVRPGEWTIVTRPVEGTEITDLAQGYAPSYLDDEHIAYLAEEGITVLDTTAATTTLLFRFQPEIVVDSLVRYSPDRTKILWTNALTGETMVASITRDSLTLVPSVRFSGRRNLILTNTAVYETRAGDNGLVIWRHGLDGSEPVPVFTIPASLGVKMLLL